MKSMKLMVAMVAVMLTGGSLAAAAEPGSARADKPVELVVVIAARPGADHAAPAGDDAFRIGPAVERPRVDLAPVEIDAPMPTLSF